MSTTTGMVIALLIILIPEACFIVYVIRRIGSTKQDPGHEDDWRRFGDEWQRRQ